MGSSYTTQSKFVNFCNNNICRYTKAFKRNELQAHMLTNNVDIMVITESCLNCDVSDDEITITGNKSFH